MNIKTFNFTKIIDMTYDFENSMSVFCEEETFKIERPFNFKEHNFRESLLHLFSHNGTHIDAPAHILENGCFLNDFPLENLQGSALLINLENSLNPNKDNKIILSMLAPYEYELKKVSIVIIKTGHYKYWNKNEYLSNYPVLTLESAAYLASFNIKIVGLDTISPDEYSSNKLPIHKVFLSKNILIVENLNMPSELPQSFYFMVLPLKYTNADGSPVRALAYI